MALVDFTNVHVQEELRDVAIAAFEERGNLFTAGLVPDYRSQVQAGSFRVFEREYFMASQVKERTVATATPKANYGTVTDTYDIKQYHLGHNITAERVAQSSRSPLDPFRDGTRFLASNFLKWHEQEFVNTLMATAGATAPWSFSGEGQAGAITPGGGFTHLSNTPDSTFATSNFQQFDQAASEPLRILREHMLHMQKMTGIRPNKLVIPRLAFEAIINNPTVKAFAANTLGLNGGQEQTKAIIALALDLDMSNIMIIDAVVNKATTTYADRTGNFAQNALYGELATLGAENQDWVASKDILFFFSGEDMGLYSKTAATRFLWTGLTNAMQDISGSAASASGDGMDLGNFFMHAYSDKINMTHTIDAYLALQYKIVSPDLAVLLKNVIA